MECDQYYYNIMCVGVWFFLNKRNENYNFMDTYYNSYVYL